MPQVSTPDSGATSTRIPQPPAVTGHIPSLDGLRAISILMVVVGHLVYDANVRGPAAGLAHMGNYGVRIFYLISGFLITTLLLKEYRKYGNISLKDFYIRRILRIFPAFYVFLLVVAILVHLDWVNIKPGEMGHALTYTTNYYKVKAWTLNHTWSLSVEEQFYLLWPVTFVLAKPGNAIRIAGAVVLLGPFIRTFMHFVLGASELAVGRHFEAISDALALGCLLAGTYNRVGEWRWYQNISRRPWFLVVPLSLLAIPVAMNAISSPLYYLPGQTIANLGGIILIEHCVRYPKSFPQRVLDWMPLRMIGLWSYSLYLWQELFLAGAPRGWRLGFPLNLVAILAASLISYYLVEKQFLKLKERLGAVR